MEEGMEGMQTVFYLNVDNLDGEEIIRLENEEYTYSVQEDGTIEYENGIDMEQYGEGDAFEFEEITTMPLEDNGNDAEQSLASASSSAGQPGKRKAAAPFVAEDESDPSPVLEEKRPKLVINLYEEDVGYEFGCISNQKSNVIMQMSHLIPYSEDYVLRAVDREEIPYKVLKPFAPALKWKRGHLVAEVRDYRRFSKKNKNGKSSGGVGGSSTSINSNSSGISSGGGGRVAPVIRDVLLRPNTQSILHDFEELIEESAKSRERWKNKVKGKSKGTPQPQPPTSSLANSSDDEEGDCFSDNEVEFDIPSSLKASDTLTYDQRLELEKQFINITAGSLCLDPSPDVSFIQNKIQFERNKWRCPSLIESRLSIAKSKGLAADLQEEEEEDAGNVTGPREKAATFLKFIQTAKDRLNSGLILKDLVDPLKLNGLQPYQEYPILDPPSSMEEIMKIAQTPEPCSIRPLSIDNVVKKIEDYTLETERRKRPHTTKLSIYQRNGIDSYFGELEMESILEGQASITNRPGAVKDNSLNSTKCQFELGSSSSVSLYVKQFSDIFTEDGRRPCKITYQKVGQFQPQVLYTNSYKTLQAAAAAATSNSPATSTSTTSPGSASAGAGASTTPTAPPIQATQPPVQIVHPQPRTPQPDPATSSSSSSNFQQPQTLTRPQQIVSLQPQVKVSPATAPPASQQQLLQQRLLRLKQQQQQAQQNAAAAAAAQQQQQPQTALAKLLLTNIQQPSTSGGSGGMLGTGRPITVAVQPQPQKIVEKHLPQPSSAAAAAVASQGSQLNLNLNGAQNVSLNLNTMMVDSSQSSAHQLRSHHPMNILRVNNNNNQTMVGNSGSNNNSASGLLHQQRQFSAGSSSLSSLLQQSPLPLQQQQQQQQNINHLNNSRILINANNGQQITLTGSGSVDSVPGGDELGGVVPDLSSLLASSPSVDNNIAQQQQHNLNLNLNVNLNSLTTSSDGGGALGGGAAGHQGPPPFLVFISPLRSVPVSINQNQGRTSLLQQHLNAPTMEQQQMIVENGSGGGGGGDLFSAINDAIGPVGQKLEGSFVHQDAVGGRGRGLSGSGGSNGSSSGSGSVMIGNSSYSESKKEGDTSVITLSDLLGTNTNTNSSLMLHGVGSSGSGMGGGAGGSSVSSSTPRLSALLAGTPSADGSGGGNISSSPGNRSLSSLIGGGAGSVDPSTPRTLLDRLTASISTNNAGGVEGAARRSGLNPIASATPNVVLEHPVLAATLTGQPSPKVVGYRQIAPQIAPPGLIPAPAATASSSTSSNRAGGASGH